MLAYVLKFLVYKLIILNALVCFSGSLQTKSSNIKIQIIWKLREQRL